MMLQTSQDLVMGIPSYHNLSISIRQKPPHLWQIIVIIGFITMIQAIIQPSLMVFADNNGFLQNENEATWVFQMLQTHMT